MNKVQVALITPNNPDLMPHVLEFMPFSTVRVPSFSIRFYMERPGRPWVEGYQTSTKIHEMDRLVFALGLAHALMNRMQAGRTFEQALAETPALELVP